MTRYYLRIVNNDFGFRLEEENDIIESDIEITKSDYDIFFYLQSQGKQFRLKEIATGNTLFDYVEEYVPEVIIDTTPTDKDRIKALEMVMLEVL